MRCKRTLIYSPAVKKTLTASSVRKNSEFRVIFNVMSTCSVDRIQRLSGIRRWRRRLTCATMSHVAAMWVYYTISRRCPWIGVSSFTSAPTCQVDDLCTYEGQRRSSEKISVAVRSSRPPTITLWAWSVTFSASKYIWLTVSAKRYQLPVEKPEQAVTIFYCAKRQRCRSRELKPVYDSDDVRCLYSH